jgi:hypothetical protein
VTRHRRTAAWEVELAGRTTSPDRVAAAAARGRALCDAVLAGQILPDPQPLPGLPVGAPVPVDLTASVRLEMTACARCFAPHEAPQSSVCGRCQTTESTA